MAKPQGKKSPFMVPLGSSLKTIVTNPANPPGGTFIDIANISNPGHLLGIGIRSDPGSIAGRNYEDQFKVDNATSFSSSIVHNTATAMLQITTNNITDDYGFVPYNLPFNFLQIQARNILIDSVTEAMWTTVWYCERMVPHIPNVRQPSIINFDYGTQTDIYENVLSISNSGGVIEMLMFGNASVNFVSAVTLRMTFDGGTAVEYDMSQIGLPPTYGFKQSLYIPFKIRWNNSILIEIKDRLLNTTDAALRIAQISYSLDQ